MSTKLMPADRMTPELRDKLLNKVVDVVDRYGLYAPAAFFVAMSKPVAFLGSQAMFMISPLAGAFINEEIVEDYAQLMTDRNNVDYLLNMMEERELEGRRKMQEQRDANRDPSKPTLIERVKKVFHKS